MRMKFASRETAMERSHRRASSGDLMQRQSQEEKP
jgi:hypothetical protein